MWASESFMNCLKRKDEPSEGGAEAEVETIVLSWDEKHGKFNGGFSNEATKSWLLGEVGGLTQKSVGPFKVDWTVRS